MGVGVRVISGERTGYAYSDDLSPEKIRKASNVAAHIAAGPSKVEKFDLNEGNKHNLYPVLVAPSETAFRERVDLVKRADLKKHTFDVIINATPVGMGNTRESPLHENEIQARYVFDMIYDPVETRLMKFAKARGAQVIPGIEMFVHQAARQFEIWTGKPAPWDDMLRVVTLALQERTARNAAKEQKKK